MQRAPTDLAHRFRSPVGQDLPQTLHLVQSSLHRNLNKEVTGDTQVIFSKLMDFTVAKLVVNMDLEALEVIKQLGKATKAANMEATRLSEATSMATASNNAEDGAATMDINWPHQVAARPW
jgi:hypothetical protein